MIRPIRHDRDFQRLRDHGRTVRADAVRIRMLDDAPLGEARVAYAIGRSCGNAVTRNRLRRQLRAILADADRAGALAPGWYLVSLTTPSATPAGAQLRTSVMTALVRGSDR